MRRRGATRAGATDGAAPRAPRPGAAGERATGSDKRFVSTPRLFTRTAAVSLIGNAEVAAPQLFMGRLLLGPPRRKESPMMWKLRALLDDRPGAMAALAVSCGEQAVNIMDLQIFPAPDGRVVDEFIGAHPRRLE